MDVIAPVRPCDPLDTALIGRLDGSATTLDGAELRYGKPGLENPVFLAHGG